MKKARFPLSYFTLIELLIAISIIAILAAMLLPALSRVKEKSRRVVCLNSVRQMAQATMLYTGDFNKYLPLSNAAARDEYGAWPLGVECAWFRESTASWPVNGTHGPEMPMGHAVLYKEGYISGIEDLFYCPSLSQIPELSFTLFSRYNQLYTNGKWGGFCDSDRTKPSKYYTTNYQYRGYPSGTGALKLSKVEGDEALISDIWVRTWATTSHNAEVLSTAFVDGHAVHVRDFSPILAEGVSNTDFDRHAELWALYFDDK